MFESFPNMNTNRNEISQSTPDQMAAADAILKGSTLSLEETPKEEGRAHFGGEFNVHLMQEKKDAAPGQMKKDPFDEAGRHVPDANQVEAADKILEERGSGLTLQ